MTTAMMNGAARGGSAQRKSLAQQLDRMDGLLDGLSDGIQAAVVDAVKDAVGQAVQAALREVLTHPGVTARLAAAPAPIGQPAPEPAPAARRPSWAGRVWASVRARAARLRNRLGDFVGDARTAVRAAPKRLLGIARFFWTLARHNLRTVVLALAVGAAAGAACYYAGPVVAAAVSGVVTAVLAGATRLLAPLAGLLVAEGEA